MSTDTVVISPTPSAKDASVNACCIFRRLKKPRSPPALGPELQSLFSRANFVNALAIDRVWVGGWAWIAELQD